MGNEQSADTSVVHHFGHRRSHPHTHLMAQKYDASLSRPLGSYDPETEVVIDRQGYGRRSLDVRYVSSIILYSNCEKVLKKILNLNKSFSSKYKQGSKPNCKCPQVKSFILLLSSSSFLL